MRIAVVGAGLSGLSAAHYLSEDPRHATVVFETRARFGGRGNEHVVARLGCAGVTLRTTAQVERLAVDESGAYLWIHGLAERFDLALVTTSPAEARALLGRSGLTRQLRSARLGKRIYFIEHGSADADCSARTALARMAADHPGLGPRPCRRLTPTQPARRAERLRDSHVQCLDLSGHAWPLSAPAVYIANQRWILDALPHQLMLSSLWAPDASLQTTAPADELEAGRSLAFVVEGGLTAHGRATRAAPHGRGAAVAALAVNAPIVPIAANGRPGTRARILRRPQTTVLVVIGEPFYPETSAIDELMDDMRMVLRHLERLAIDGRARPRLDPEPKAARPNAHARSA